MVRGKGVSGCTPTAHCGLGRPRVRVYESRGGPPFKTGTTRVQPPHRAAAAGTEPDSHNAKPTVIGTCCRTRSAGRSLSAAKFS